MSTETKTLKEDLNRSIDILAQNPLSLNIYVEQVNTLKYVRERMPDFNQKFSSIEKLNELCKKHNIKVNVDLQENIQRVEEIYR